MKFILSFLILIEWLGGCAGVPWLSHSTEVSRPISNPFGSTGGDSNTLIDPIIVRSKRGDQALELQFPSEIQKVSDLTVPLSIPDRISSDSPASIGKEERAPASVGDSSEPLSETDYELQKRFQGLPESLLTQQQEVERTLFLVEDRTAPVSKVHKTYLSALDEIQKEYRSENYGKAIQILDGLLKRFSKNPRLLEKKGSLLSLIGERELALQSWKAALALDPKNERLKKFVAQQEKKRRSFP